MEQVSEWVKRETRVAISEGPGAKQEESGIE